MGGPPSFEVFHILGGGYIIALVVDQYFVFCSLEYVHALLMIVKAAAVPTNDDKSLDDILILISLDLCAYTLDLADELRQALPKHKGVSLFLVLVKERNPLHSLLDFLLPDVLHSFIDDHPGNRNGVVGNNNSWEDHVSDCLGYLGSSPGVVLDVVCNHVHCLLVLCCILSISHIPTSKVWFSRPATLVTNSFLAGPAFLAELHWKFFLFPSTLGFRVSFSLTIFLFLVFKWGIVLVRLGRYHEEIDST
jgi:hypothetical protein